MEQLEGQISIEEYLENKYKDSIYDDIKKILNKYNIKYDSDEFSKFLENLGKN